MTLIFSSAAVPLTIAFQRRASPSIPFKRTTWTQLDPVFIFDRVILVTKSNARSSYCLCHHPAVKDQMAYDIAGWRYLSSI